MARKQCRTEQITAKLREAVVRLPKGRRWCKQMGKTEHTYYRWRPWTASLRFGLLAAGAGGQVKTEEPGERPERTSSIICWPNSGG